MDSFQDKEKEIILLSLVRNNNVSAVGFMTDGQRFNVAVTRTSQVFILIGNVEFWKGATENFQDLIRHCQEVNSIVGEPIQTFNFLDASCSEVKKTSARERFTSSTITDVLVSGIARLSAADKCKIIDQCFEAIEFLLLNKDLGSILIIY